jgi:hypothetical protein
MFSQTQWTDWSGQPVLCLPNSGVAKRLLRCAGTTRRGLQQRPHLGPLEAQSKVEQARLAFQQWRAVRTQPVAQDYLLAFLVGRKRR